MADYDWFNYKRPERLRWAQVDYSSHTKDAEIAYQEGVYEASLEVLEGNLDRRIGRFEQ